MKAELVYRVTLIFVHIVKIRYTNNSKTSLRVRNCYGTLTISKDVLFLFSILSDVIKSYLV